MPEKKKKFQCPTFLTFKSKICDGQNYRNIISKQTKVIQFRTTTI